MKKEAQSLNEYIRLEAYLLSEKAGHPSGMDEFFWAQAEEIVHGRIAVVVAPGKPQVKAKPTVATKVKPVKKAVSVETALASKPGKAAKPKTKPVGKRAK